MNNRLINNRILQTNKNYYKALLTSNTELLLKILNIKKSINIIFNHKNRNNNKPRVNN